jgi:hypothetical protein
MIYGGTHDFTGATITGTGATKTFDAVVAATGGDYTTLSAALTAGKKSIFVKSGTYTEASNINITTANTFIMGESRDGVIIDCTDTTSTCFTMGAANIHLFNLTVRGAATNAQILYMNGNNGILNFVSVINNHNGNPAAARGVLTISGTITGIFVSNVRISNANATNMANRYCLYMNDTNTTRVIVNNVEIVGASSANSQRGIYCLASGCVFNNILLRSLGTTGDVLAVFAGSSHKISNIVATGCLGNYGWDVALLDSEIANVSCDHDNAGTFSCKRCKFTNLNFEGTTGITVDVNTSHNLFTNCNFGPKTITVNGDDNVFSGCKVGLNAHGGTGTFSIGAGSDRTIITGCQTDAAIVDAGTGTSGANNVVF